ncbi:hypothetical protein ACNKHW_04015 [Shigella flexneri]
MGEGDVMVTMPNHPNKPEMGSREVPFSREIWIDRADFREEANKQYKRLVLNKEVRLRNAFVIKAERADKDTEGNITTIYCTYDAETLNKDSADGRKVKGVIHWVSVNTRYRWKSVCMIVCSVCLTPMRKMTSWRRSDRILW